MNKKPAFFAIAVLSGMSFVAAIGAMISSIDAMSELSIITIVMTVPWTGFSTIFLVESSSQFYMVECKNQHETIEAPGARHGT